MHTELTHWLTRVLTALELIQNLSKKSYPPTTFVTSYALTIQACSTTSTLLPRPSTKRVQHVYQHMTCEGPVQELDTGTERLQNTSWLYLVNGQAMAMTLITFSSSPGTVETCNILLNMALSIIYDHSDGICVAFKKQPSDVFSNSCMLPVPYTA